MSQQLTNHTSSVPAKREFPKIDKFFDTAIHIAERSEELLAKSKPLLVSLFLFIETILILIFVLTK
jgi:hypothetical protein